METGLWWRYNLSGKKRNMIVMGGEKCSPSCEEIRVRTCCGVNSRNLPGSLAAVGEVERVEKETLLVRSNFVQAGGCGRADGKHGILLLGTRKPGDDDSGQVGSGQNLP